MQLVNETYGANTIFIRRTFTKNIVNLKNKFKMFVRLSILLPLK